MCLSKKNLSRESFSLMLTIALVFSPSVALVASITADKTISNAETDTQNINTANITIWKFQNKIAIKLRSFAWIQMYLHEARTSNWQ